ncbi:MAG TPA: hydrogenase expression/formation protein HypE [Candidatus Eremiobacteraeota bacterium]|nr:MAG: Hydrogenase expression/formation protein HypE [bacterium ADurb.Bin363]HPZ08335.1 hydrogenase expression/formation protein HypE [Candidatus Eremiobacteraeota bacterium]
MNKILLAHGGGGALTDKLIKEEILKRLGNSLLTPLEDSAVFNIGNKRLAFTTDSFVVKPLFFPGGDIGKLSVCGTVNDLSVAGAIPLYLSLSLIIEEGFSVEKLQKIILSIEETTKEAGVFVVTGDTKVVEKGGADEIFINTSGIGVIEYESPLSLSRAKEGDKIIINGYVADHGISVLLQRSGMEVDLPVHSDVAPLNGLVRDILNSSKYIRCLKDPTRGGVAGALNEIATSSSAGIIIFEENLPIRKEVKAACNLLGFDPFTIANEGKVIVICPEEEAEKVLSAMRRNSLGRLSVIIGEVVNTNNGKVLVKTPIGGMRILERPYGENFPRIC